MYVDFCAAFRPLNRYTLSTQEVLVANLNKLTAKQVQALKSDSKKPSRYSDGGGFYSDGA